MPEKVFRVSPVLCVVGEDGKVKCSAGSATEAPGITSSDVNNEIAAARATTLEGAAAEAARSAAENGHDGATLINVTSPHVAVKR